MPVFLSGIRFAGQPAQRKGRNAVLELGDTEITTGRLRLTALVPQDADEMAVVLGDERLHEFTGGQPAGRAELRARYGRLAAGSPDPAQVWLNWIIRQRDSAHAVGTVQATLVTGQAGTAAYVAWVVGAAWQGRGFASEAAAALTGWLRDRGVADVMAHIHPAHLASAAVAARAGLAPTGEFADGERVWRLPADAGQPGGSR